MPRPIFYWAYAANRLVNSANWQSFAKNYSLCPLTHLSLRLKTNKNPKVNKYWERERELRDTSWVFQEGKVKNATWLGPRRSPCLECCCCHHCLPACHWLGRGRGAGSFWACCKYSICWCWHPSGAVVADCCVRSPFPGSSRGSPGPQGSLRWQRVHLSRGTLPLFSSAVRHWGCLFSVSNKTWADFLVGPLPSPTWGVVGGDRGGSLRGQGDTPGIGDLALLQVLHQLCKPAFRGGVIF